MNHSTRSTAGLLTAALTALATFAVGPRVVSAGDEGITVHGAGFATARPSQVEMSATLNGDAELAADAIVKFRDAKKRALAAIAGLKNPDLSISSGGITIGSGQDANAQMAAMRGVQVQNSPTSVHISETSRIILANTDKLEPEEMLNKLLKIIDTAKDAGFQIGPAPPRNYIEMQIRAQEGDAGVSVSFKLPDTAALREKAYKAAIDDARAKAKSLADLTGAKLGKIIAVRDEEAASTSESPSALNFMYGVMSSSKTSMPADNSLTGQSSGELTMHVNLTVQFEIAK